MRQEFKTADLEMIAVIRELVWPELVKSCEL